MKASRSQTRILTFIRRAAFFLELTGADAWAMRLGTWEDAATMLEVDRRLVLQAGAAGRAHALRHKWDQDTAEAAVAPAFRRWCQ